MPIKGLLGSAVEQMPTWQSQLPGSGQAVEPNFRATNADPSTADDMELWWGKQGYTAPTSASLQALQAALRRTQPNGKS
ncbi:MAG TPA: hypothetical protein VGH84_00760 [Steroidobacteraceae bacterium]|jgi:hypothetical protein